MALNGYLPREGDILTIRATVKYDVESTEKRIHLRALGGHSDFSVPMDDNVSLFSKNWNEGDKVVLAHIPPDDSDYGIGTVLSTCDQAVWVKFNVANPQTVNANDLLAAPAPALQDGE